MCGGVIPVFNNFGSRCRPPGSRQQRHSGLGIVVCGTGCFSFSVLMILGGFRTAAMASMTWSRERRSNDALTLPFLSPASTSSSPSLWQRTNRGKTPGGGDNDRGENPKVDRLGRRLGVRYIKGGSLGFGGASTTVMRSGLCGGHPQWWPWEVPSQARNASCPMVASQEKTKRKGKGH